MKLKQTKLFFCILVGIISFVSPTFALDSLDSLRLQFEKNKSEQANYNVDVLVKLSWEYRRRSADSTILYAQEALEIAQKNNYLKGQAGAFKNIGVGYSIKGEIDSALVYMEASLNTSKQLGDEFLIGRNLNNLGLTHHRQGSYEIALDYYLKSLQISEKIGDATSGVTLMNIGLLQQKTEDYDNALVNFRRALSVAESEDNPNRIASCLYNIGSVYHQKKQLDNARNYYQQALKYAEKNKDLLLSSKLQLSIGRVFRMENQYHTAISYFEKSQSTATSINDRETVAQTWSEFAFISYQEKKFQKTLDESLNGLKIAEEIKSKEVQKNLLRLISDSYANLGQYKAAFEYNQEFIRISDELFNKEKARKINELHISKEAQEKEKEILKLQAQKVIDESVIKEQKAKYSIAFLAFLLTCLALAFLYSVNKSQRNENKNLEERVAKRTEELELANIDLRNSNEELERFAFITSHDLKEPLRNISGFTGLLRRKLKGNLDEEGKSYIQYVQKNTQQMHQLIEDVLEYSRIGKEKNTKDLIDLNQVFQKAYNNLPTDLIEKKKEVAKQNLPKVEGIESNLILIFTNLIENGLKYNESEVAKVEVRVKEHSSYWQFSVKDNGIGIADEFLDQIFVMFKRLHNREEYNGSGLGLAIVKKLVEMAGGEIWVESTVNIGTTFFFTFPKNDTQKQLTTELPLEMVN